MLDFFHLSRNTHLLYLGNKRLKTSQQFPASPLAMFPAQLSLSWAPDIFLISLDCRNINRHCSMPWPHPLSAFSPPLVRWSPNAQIRSCAVPRSKRPPVSLRAPTPAPLKHYFHASSPRTFRFSGPFSLPTV